MVDLEAIAKECGVKFYDSEAVNENGNNIYRVYIIKENGIQLENCEAMSRILSPIYDIEPPMAGEWFLEVSSPGLERKLIKPIHFENSIGELVKITTSEKEKLIGKIVAFSNNILTIQNADGDVQINFDDIKKARTYIEW